MNQEVKSNEPNMTSQTRLHILKYILFVSFGLLYIGFFMWCL